MPTQSTDVYGDPYGIVFSANNQTWRVTKGVEVTGAQTGILSEFRDSTLVNKGSVFGLDAGVNFNPNDPVGAYVVKNKGAGEIGGFDGVYVNHINGTVFLQNQGTIWGLDSGVRTAGSGDVEIENTDHISGGVAAVSLMLQSAGSAGVAIDNEGVMESPQFGVVIENGFGLLATITNHADGVIKGIVAIASEERLKLNNEGKIKGAIRTDGYDDKIVNKSTVKGPILLGDGNDMLKNKGKAKTGLIDSRDGHDTLVLGKKTDKLLFDSTLKASSNIDRVKKFASGEDRFYLDEDFFTMLTAGKLKASEFHKGGSASSADHHIIYAQKSGALYYDEDGIGPTNQIQFAQLDSGAKLKASDFRVGEFTVDLVI